jgi:hypothetical protein
MLLAVDKDSRDGSRRPQSNLQNLIYLAFCIFAAFMFYFGVFSGSGSFYNIHSSEWSHPALFATEIYLVFTLEAIQLLLHFVMAHLAAHWELVQCDDDGYELFKEGFRCMEFCIFVLAAVIALSVGILFSKFAAIVKNVVAALCGLLLLVAVCAKPPQSALYIKKVVGHKVEEIKDKRLFI